MTELAILMTAENAQKCHDGLKTQTRRLNFLEVINTEPAMWECTKLSNGSFVFSKIPPCSHGHIQIECPYGGVGGRLWTREAFSDCAECGRVIFKGQHIGHCPGCDKSCADLKWSRSIHMPRWACRTVLEITDVRVERLQQISAEDAIAEGVFCPEIGYVQHGDRAPVLLFGVLWESIHGKGSWDKNPWVWVISFRKVLS